MKRILHAASKRLSAPLAAPAAALAAAGYAVLGTTTAWAQAQPAAPGASTAPSGGAYVLPYALLILCVFLGVFLVVRPTKRRDKPKT